MQVGLEHKKVLLLLLEHKQGEEKEVEGLHLHKVEGEVHGGTHAPIAAQGRGAAQAPVHERVARRGNTQGRGDVSQGRGSAHASAAAQGREVTQKRRPAQPPTHGRVAPPLPGFAPPPSPASVPQVTPSPALLTTGLGAMRALAHVSIPPPPPPPPRESLSAPQFSVLGIKPEPYLWKGQQVVTQESLQATTSARRYRQVLYTAGKNGNASKNASTSDNVSSGGGN